MAGKLSRVPSAGNHWDNEPGIVTGAQAQFLVKQGMRDAGNYTTTKIQSGTLFHIDSDRPVPWYNRNPIAQGVHAPGTWAGPKQTPIGRMTNNQM